VRAGGLLAVAAAPVTTVDADVLVVAVVEVADVVLAGVVLVDASSGRGSDSSSVASAGCASSDDVICAHNMTRVTDRLRSHARSTVCTLSHTHQVDDSASQRQRASP
jgi:hypothetical protein